ncbi:electron transfer flavoprotein subunit beta/FixA family protein [Pseudothermotoga thermarum]|uniref:Electron transfer flavoprotein alpha/beta-subunit n=1 Tax=Pseudothermotoga thermarum DSM 5069 TaxID=688269 RepID=F7YVD9_9THEM|nr:electron transfer flavoprotein subunit beta/FixA family protein [Pseudothermotoga thermarum]AEH50442.1 Electron transfer flavoprotein alpha/beta-subunit [Pseudothermotoga thermarum DSM 5069]
MKILVLAKQVPDTDKVKIDPNTGTMIREGLDAVMNPLDMHALEVALRIKETTGAHITVLSMGPAKTEEMLKDSLAFGVDRAILLTDAAFAGSDTWATSYVLSEAVKRLKIEYDLVLCGEKATDGETGQVGIEFGVLLNLPIVTYVSRIFEVSKEFIVVERTTEEAFEKWKVKLPAVISVLKSVAEPRLPTLNGKKRAMNQKIEIYNAQTLGFKPEEIGLNGSPTKVIRVCNTKLTRNCKLFVGKETTVGVRKVVELLKPFLRK